MKPKTIRRRWFWPMAAIVAATSCVAFAALEYERNPRPVLQRYNVWSIAVVRGRTPWCVQDDRAWIGPVLTARDVTDVPARFVADPFFVRDGNAWFMFFEVLNAKTSQGDIGLAASPNGTDWEYCGIVLDEPFHVSYPMVFREGPEFFMIPESAEAGGVRLYRATRFPIHWEFVQELIHGAGLADPTLFQYEGKFWMFVGQADRHAQLRLYFADQLAGPWQEHPQSPVIVHNPNLARPGGRIVHFEGQLFRIAQDCWPNYGNALRVFRIVHLDSEHYCEIPLQDRPLLEASGRGWNAVGMHHMDLQPLEDGTWFGVIDGHRKVWKIGLERGRCRGEGDRD